VIKDLDEDLKHAAADLDFERAAKLRDKILALEGALE